MAKEIQGLSLLDPKGTLTKSGSPLALGEDIRGAFFSCDTVYRNSIDGRRLERGMIIYNETNTRYEVFTPQSGNIRSSVTGAFSNGGDTEWIELETGSVGGQTAQQVLDAIAAAAHGRSLTGSSFDSTTNILTLRINRAGGDFQTIPIDLSSLAGGGIETLTGIEPILVTGSGDSRSISAHSANASRHGTVELATSAETIAGTDATRVITPAALQAKIDALPALLTYIEGDGINIVGNTISGEQANTNNRGIVQLAGDPVALAGTSNSTAVTPASLTAVKNTIKQVPAGGTTNQVLTKGGGDFYSWADSTGSGGGTTYTAGTGLTLNGTVFSVSTPFTTLEKTKLATVETGAEENVDYSGHGGITVDNTAGTIGAVLPTTTQFGITRFARDAEIDSGVNTHAMINPQGLQRKIDAIPIQTGGGGTTYTAGEAIDITGDVIRVENATTTNKGAVALATGTAVQQGTQNATVVTPAGLKSVTDLIRQVPSGGDTGQILTRDGSTGSLWADAPEGSGGGGTPVTSTGGFATVDLVVVNIDVTTANTFIGTGLVIPEDERTGYWLINFGYFIPFITNFKTLGKWHMVDAAQLFGVSAGSVGGTKGSTNSLTFQTSGHDDADVFISYDSTGQVLFATSSVSSDAYPLTIRKVINSGTAIIANGIPNQLYNLYISNDTSEAARAGTFPDSKVDNFFPGFMNFTDDATKATANPFTEATARSAIAIGGIYTFENIENVSADGSITLFAGVPISIRSSGGLNVKVESGLPTGVILAHVTRRVLLNGVSISQELTGSFRVRASKVYIPLDELSYDFIPPVDLPYNGSTVQYDLNFINPDSNITSNITFDYWLGSDTKEVVTQLNPEIIGADVGGSNAGGLSTVISNETLVGDGSEADPLGVIPDYHNSDVVDETPRNLDRYGDGAVIFNREGTEITEDASFIDVRAEVARSDPEFTIIGETTFTNSFIGDNPVTGHGVYVPADGGTVTGGVVVTDPLSSAFLRFFHYNTADQGRFMVFTNIGEDNDLRANRLIITVNDVVLGEWGVTRHNEPINRWNIFDTYLQHNLFGIISAGDDVKLELHVNHNYMFQAAVQTRYIRPLKEVVRHDLRSLAGTPEAYGTANQALLVNSAGDGTEWNTIQSDWNEPTVDSPQYIRNKPHIIREDVQAADHLDLGSYTTGSLTSNLVNTTVKQTLSEPLEDMDDDDYLSFEIETDSNAETNVFAPLIVRIGFIKEVALNQVVAATANASSFKKLSTVIGTDTGGAFRFFIIPGKIDSGTNTPIEFWYTTSSAVSSTTPITVNIKKIPFSLIGAALENRQHVYDTELVADLAVNITQTDRFVATDIQLTNTDWWLLSLGRSHVSNAVPIMPYFKIRTKEVYDLTHSQQGGQVNFNNSMYFVHDGVQFYFGRTSDRKLLVATNNAAHDLHNLKIYKELTATALRGPAGEGFEIIFYSREDIEATITLPDNSWAYGEPLGNWVINPPTPIPQFPETFGSLRIKLDGVWQSWNDPFLFQRFTRDGIDGITPDDGEDGDPGDPGVQGNQGIPGNGDFAALAMTQIGSQNLTVTTPLRYVASGITLPATGEWFIINFGADEVTSQRLGNNYWIRGTQIRELTALSVNALATGAVDRAIEIEGSNPAGRRAYIGRTSSNEILISFNAAAGGLSAFPFTVYGVEVADAYTAGTGIVISPTNVISSPIVAGDGIRISNLINAGVAIFAQDATTDQKGIAEFATTGQALLGSDNKITTPLHVRAIIAQDVPNASTTVRGRVELATITEVNAGSDTTRAVTPAGVNAAIQIGLGSFDAQFSNKNIEDLNNVPALVANRVLTVNSAGTATAWTVPNDAGTVYTAGDGLNLNNNQFSVELSSTTNRGSIELATNAETQAGNDDQRAVTPSGLSSLVDIRGIPSGGSHDQVLAKNGSGNYSTRWINGGFTQSNVTSGNLNDIITTGYYLIGTNVDNKPSNASGALRVLRGATTSNYYRQEYWEYDSNTYHSRQTFSGSNGWGSWVEITGSGGGGGTTYTAGAGLDLVGNEFRIESATTTNRGGVFLATSVDTQLGTQGLTAVTPLGLKSVTDNITEVPAGGTDNQLLSRNGTTGLEWVDPPSGEGGGGITNLTGIEPILVVGSGTSRSISAHNATTSRHGTVELATPAETLTGTDGSRAVTPEGVQAALDALGGPGTPAEHTVLGTMQLTGTAVNSYLWSNNITPSIPVTDLDPDDVIVFRFSTPSSAAYYNHANVRISVKDIIADTQLTSDVSSPNSQGVSTAGNQYTSVLRGTSGSVALFVHPGRATATDPYRFWFAFNNSNAQFHPLTVRAHLEPLGSIGSGGGGGTYTAGAGIDINNSNVISAEVATTTNVGGIELATNAEVLSGIDTIRAVTPFGLQSKIDALPNPGPTYTAGEGIDFVGYQIKIESATTTNIGGVALATGAETFEGIDAIKAITPEGLKVVTDRIIPVPAGGDDDDVVTKHYGEVAWRPTQATYRIASIRHPDIDLDNLISPGFYYSNGDDLTINTPPGAHHNGGSIIVLKTDNNPPNYAQIFTDTGGNIPSQWIRNYSYANDEYTWTSWIVALHIDAESLGSTNQVLTRLSGSGNPYGWADLPQEFTGYTAGTGIDIIGDVISAEYASTFNEGIVELSTQAEAIAGTSSTKAVTPIALQAKIDELPAASQSNDIVYGDIGNNEDLNDYQSSGWYRITGSTVYNKPGSSEGVLLVLQTNATTNVVQVYYDFIVVSEPHQFTRSWSGTSWGAWESALHVTSNGSLNQVLTATGVTSYGWRDPNTYTAGNALSLNGNTFNVAVASASNRGVVELSTNAETETGTSTTRAVTPSGLQAKLDNFDAGTTYTEGEGININVNDVISAELATTTNPGVVELSTSTEAIASSSTTRAVTPSGLGAKLRKVTQSEYDALTPNDNVIYFIT